MKAYRFPPGPRALPVFGNSISYRKDRLGYLTQVYHDYGPSVTIHFGSTPGVMITRPSAIREMNVQLGSKFNKGQFSDNRLLFTGETLRPRHLMQDKKFRGCCGCGQEQSIVSMDGDMHDSQRAAIAEAFHGPALDQYRDIMASLTQRMLDSWGAGQEIELFSEMQNLSASIVFQTLFGIDVQDRSDLIVKAYANVLKHSASLFRPFKSASDTRREAAWTGLTTFVDQIVSQNTRRRDHDGSVLLVDMILRGAPPNKANEVVRDQILAFMGAGQVTVAGTLTWAISLLVRHPNILARVTEEIQTVLQGSAPTGRDLTKMTYLDWVVKETLRLFPAVWLHGRVAKEDVEIDGWFLPKGTNVFFSEWVTQRAEEYFSEPLRFAPERFAPVSSFVHNSDAYIPWGMGPRACIGAGFATLEAKVVLSMLLPRFTPALVDPNDRLEPTPRSILLQPRGAVRMRMQPAPMRRLELAHAN